MFIMQCLCQMINNGKHKQRQKRRGDGWRCNHWFENRFVTGELNTLTAIRKSSLSPRQAQNHEKQAFGHGRLSSRWSTSSFSFLQKKFWRERDIKVSDVATHIILSFSSSSVTIKIKKHSILQYAKKKKKGRRKIWIQLNEDAMTKSRLCDCKTHHSGSFA